MAYLLVALMLVIALPGVHNAAVGRSMIVCILVMVALYFNDRLRRARK